LPSSEIDLMSQLSQRSSTAVTHGDAAGDHLGRGVASGLLIMNTVAGTSCGKAWSRLRDAARHLEVDALVVERMPLDDASTNRLPSSSLCGLSSRMRLMLFCSRARCLGHPERLPVIDRDQLVDANRRR
jgi:hypothetical protein